MKQSQRPWLTLLATGIGSLIISVGFSIINTILANIQKDLGASVEQLQWMVSGFGLLFCTFLITMGRIGDIIGHRLILIIGLIGFGFVSLVGGLAAEPWHLIICTTCQGIFAAMIFPTGLALVAAAFPKAQQGRALGLKSSILGVGLAIGPVLGGIIVHFSSWRWVFFINIPFLLASLVLVIFFVKESKSNQQKSLDIWGALLLTVGISALVYGINELPSHSLFSVFTITIFIVSIIAIILFFWVENRVQTPLVPLGMLANIGFALSAIVSFVSVSVAWAILFLTPLYLHNVLNQSTFQTGLLILPMTLMTLISPTVAGYWYDRQGPLPAILTMFALLILSYFLQLLLGENFHLLVLLAAFATFGFPWGMGNGLQTPLALAQLDSNHYTGVVSGASVAVLNILGVISLAIGAAIFRTAGRTHLHTLLNQHNVRLSPSQEQLIGSAMSDSSHSEQLIKEMGHNADLIQNLFKQAFVFGYHTMIMALIVITVVFAVISIWLLKKLKSQSVSISSRFSPF